MPLNISSKQRRKTVLTFQITKTEKYLRHKGDSAQGTREKTLNNFRSRNASLKDKIVERLNRRFPETRFVSGQQIIDPSEINGTKPSERFANILHRHLKNVYKYNQMAEGYVSNANDLKKKVPFIKSQQLTDNSLTTAENRVNDHITTHKNAMPVSDLIREFTKAPYGWRDIQVIHIVVMLHKKKVRELEYRGQSRYPLEQFVSKALIFSEREVLVVKQGEAIPAEMIESARSAFREIFNTEPSAKTDGNEDTDGLKEVSDQCKQLDGFLGRALPEYDKIKKFLELNADNLSSLKAENRDKIKWLTDFFNNEDPTADFRTARKTYSELNGAINQLLKSLHEEAVKTYNEVFDSLEAEANKKEVSLSRFVTWSHKLESLKRLNSISSLRLAIKDAGSFKTQQLQSILHEEFRSKEGSQDKAEDKPVPYKPGKHYSTSVISNEQELNAFLSTLKEDMEKLLKDGKKYILK